MEKTEYLHLIDFVRPSFSSSDRLPKLIPQTSISGLEARSFYENVCAEMETDVHHLNVKDDGNKIKDCLNTKSKTKSNCSGKASLQKRQNIASFKQESVNERGNNATICMQDTLSQCQSKNDVLQAERDNHNELTLNSNLSENVVQSHHKITTPGLNHRIQDCRHADLFRLAQNGDVGGLKHLIQQGVDVNCLDSFGWTPAMSAAFEGHIQVMKTLVKAGADLFIKNPQGHTALSLAAEKRRSGVVEFIERYKLRGLSPTGSKKQEHFVKFYCEVCKSKFSDMDQATHNRTTVHIFNIGKKPKDDSFMIPSSNIGFRMMLKSGWDGNKGLGLSGQGQKFPLKTLLKSDRKGLGNKLANKPKITHFVARDKAAVASLFKSKRQENIRTLSRRALRARERKDRQKEIEIRRQLS